jgi:peroxidase
LAGEALLQETSLPATQFRSQDGSGNNLQDPTLNQAGDSLVRITTQHPFETDINPRVISNLVIGQGNPEVPDRHHLSELATTYGQFIDHDLDLVSSKGGADISIPVPKGDLTFPEGSKLQVLKAQVDAHGQPVNSITGWMDGSQVYGSDQAKADSLKAPDGAHLLMSPGDNLPIVNGSFQAGDVRVAENDYLTSIQTVWAREHNHQVDKLADEHPGWSADQLYQQAKAWTTAEMQDVAFNEWLPHILGGRGLDKYHGYDAKVDASLTPEFAGAAFRFGHSMVGDDIRKLDDQGHVLDVRTLAQDFLDGPDAFLPDGGANSLLRSQLSEEANQLDARIVPSLRNFLVDGGPQDDLAAVNIRRGEDFGLGHLNDVRNDLGLKEYKSFSQITNDKATVAALEKAYHGDVDAVDLWVGVLAEKPFHGGAIGQTGHEIIERQFEALRDGDRFYFENTQNGSGFSKHEIKEIKATSFQDILARNTDITKLQRDPFVAKDREGQGQDHGQDQGQDHGQHKAQVASAQDIVPQNLVPQDQAPQDQLKVAQAAAPLVGVDPHSDTFDFSALAKAPSLGSSATIMEALLQPQAPQDQAHASPEPVALPETLVDHAQDPLNPLKALAGDHHGLLT